MIFTETNVDASKRLTLYLEDLKCRVDRLAVDDVTHVVEDIGRCIVTDVSESPYSILSMAFQVGLGLPAVDRQLFKNAAVRMGKLVACKVLSNMDQDKTDIGREGMKTSQQS